MPENTVKMPLDTSPVAKFGAGDISERELSRERHKLQFTPPARRLPVNPKNQFSAPVNKFTKKKSQPNPNFDKIKKSLEQYMNETKTRPIKRCPKAASMEDLTPKKNGRLGKEKKNGVSSSLHSVPEELAAARVGRFMLVTAWRRRREEVRCLRKTLEFQVSCSERLRIQVCTLKSLLDSDNAKVRLAMRELERLKQKLHEKEMERAVLEREKIALEGDVTSAEDRASEMSIGWHNCRNELEGVLAANVVGAHALTLEKACSAEARAQRDHAYAKLALLQEELSQHETALAAAEVEVALLKKEAEERQNAVEYITEQLKMEKKAREKCSRECSLLQLRVTLAAEETATLRQKVDESKEEVVRLQQQLAKTTLQLEWWPRPLTRMMGAARCWLQRPFSVSEAVLWSFIPARHGC